MNRHKGVCENVWMVGGPRSSHPDDCCVYLVDAHSQLVLIDAGAGQAADKIRKNILTLGQDPSRIRTIVATHSHIDHIGGIPEIRTWGKAKVVAHALDRAGIEGEDIRSTAADIYGVQYTPTAIDILLSKKEEVHRLGDLDFHFVHTPGHTPGSICVYIDTHEGRVLFGQDIHGPFSAAWGSDLEEWRTSMNTVLSLHADILCEGHAGVVCGDDIRRYIEDLLERYRE